jgi:hypothetical protein
MEREGKPNTLLSNMFFLRYPLYKVQKRGTLLGEETAAKGELEAGQNGGNNFIRNDNWGVTKKGGGGYGSFAYAKHAHTHTQKKRETPQKTRK